jgi:hypothetical protein
MVRVVLFHFDIFAKWFQIAEKRRLHVGDEELHRCVNHYKRMYTFDVIAKLIIILVIVVEIGWLQSGM